MARFSTVAITLLSVLSFSSAWVASPSRGGNAMAMRTSSPLNMALDYNDPEVGAEFTKVQAIPIDEVEEELMMIGIKAPATMNEMDIRLMLVELRMRMSGKAPGQKQKVKKTSGFACKFEEILNTVPAFEELYEQLKEQGDHNSMNVASEYLNDKEQSISRYGKDYKTLISKIEAAINKPVEVTNTIKFSGFPANMGSDACKMTLEALGTMSSFDVTESEDFPVLEGTAVFEDIETAKKAIEQYNGMDMGMGSTIEIVSV